MHGIAKGLMWTRFVQKFLAYVVLAIDKGSIGVTAPLMRWMPSNAIGRLAISGPREFRHAV